MGIARFVACFGAFGLAALTGAQSGTVSLSAFPNVALADGRTPILVTAEVRDSRGGLVPDGTQVVFDASLGTFRESIVSTVDGQARAVLIASGLPGTSVITASAVAFNSTSNLEIEFVADRESLSSARDFIEVVSRRQLSYVPEKQIIAASAPQRGVTIRFRDIVIEADDAQVKVPEYEVVARNAKVQFGGRENEFRELNFRLDARRGLGVGTFVAETSRLRAQGPFVWLERKPRERVGVVEVKALGIFEQRGLVDPRTFWFQDLSEAVTVIHARKIVALPRRQLQFHRADLEVGGVTVMRLPLFQLSSTHTAPVVTDSFLNVTQNQLTIDYPYYLSLAPGFSSLLRLRTGTRYGQGLGAASGTFLDYELHWNRGSDLDGSLVVSGLGRSDWGLRARQYLRLDADSTLNAQVDLPAHRSLFGSVNVDRSLGDFQASLSADWGESLRGAAFRNRRIEAVFERRPIAISGLPLRLSYGLALSESGYETNSFRRSDRSASARVRLQTSPLAIGRGASLSSSLLVSGRARGSAKGPRLTTLASTTLATQLVPNWSVVFGYEFLDDGFDASLLGRHRLSVQSFFADGRLSWSAFFAKSADIDRMNFFVDGTYRLSPLWRLSASHSLDRFAGRQYETTGVLLGYRVGFREIGLSYSTRTRRIGFEFLGTAID